MTTRIIHDQFTIERVYPHPPTRVFAALADPAEKRRWFAEAEGIVADERIVFAYHMNVDEAPLSSSLASMELIAEGAGTRLRYTEHAMYLDGHDQSAGRREGCERLLERLASEVGR